MYKVPFYNSVDTGVVRKSSAPYISGDTFRALADHVLDEENPFFLPSLVKPGDKIFVRGIYLKIFFPCFHPNISVPYVLITHNTDLTLPGAYSSYLEDPKILAWFTQNCDRVHPKLHPVPIGIANRQWSHGNVALLDKKRSKKRAHLLLMNFLVDSYPEERQKVYDLFKKKAYCTPQKEFSGYLDDLAESFFVLCPRGRGLDCHRTWEALYMGAYPIVHTSSLDPLYDNLPVLIVQDWKEVTYSFLVKTKSLLQKKKYTGEKLQYEYWNRCITKSTIPCR